MVIMKITLDELEAFIVVADLENFHQAAATLCISQSALSHRIKKLEGTLGAKLIDRTTRKVRLSIVGEKFLPEARHLISIFTKSIDGIEELIEGRKGVIAFSTNMTIAETILPQIVAEFRRMTPSVVLRISESSSPQALSRVLSHKSEFAIAQFGAGHPDLNFEPLIVDHFDLVCHTNHPLAHRKAIEWRDLDPYNFIKLNALSGTMRILEQSLGDKIRYTSGDIEVDHFNALLGCIGQNLGVSAIPTLVRLKRPDLNIITLPILAPQVSRTLGIVTSQDRSLSPASALFCEVCRKKLKELSLSQRN